LQCDELVAEGAVAASSPAEVVQQADITFGMLADPEAALKVGRCCLEGKDCMSGSQRWGISRAETWWLQDLYV
jgi:3-hydroxyisobutyrate dehydrogenase-like beta-hydroxyacid dehydrogenase